MPATITTPAIPKLTPEELADLVQRERAKGNPLALFAGSWIDPDDPEDKAFWEGVNQCRREMDQQQAEMDALAVAKASNESVGS
ncbi:MAG TPA: hypothetical protein VK137_18305 [Planctomycetaceae bacterium]|nr:hypothetical protein [Planctomycetaceae bacterium]